jgi:hypothetical protein
VRVLLQKLTFSLLVFGLSSAVFAQKPDQNAPTKSPVGAWEAPIGHRQPGLSDVPPEQNTAADDLLEKINRDLDKKLKSICRGC